MELPQPTFLLVAGEASGDLHGARLIGALGRRLPGARFVGMGGPLMRAAGLTPLYDARDVSVMGFVEVLPKLFRILRILSGLARWAAANRPDGAVLIDLPDFNLRLAAKLKRLGIPVAYYVAPMAWAWRESRVKTLRRLVDRLLCIYPFEERWFRERGVPASFVGNPLLEDGHLASPPSRSAARLALGLDPAAPLVALLPGSRRSEIARVLPTMLDAAARILAARPGVRFVLPVAQSLAVAELEPHLAGRTLPLQLVEGQAVACLAAADAAVVCSGTAALEAALAERPMVVVFRGNPISHFIADLLVRLPDVAMPNILAGKRIVPELIQRNFTAEAVERELLPLLDGGPAREQMLLELSRVRRELGGPGASERAAGEVLAALQERGVKLLPAPAAAPVEEVA